MYNKIVNNIVHNVLFLFFYILFFYKHFKLFLAAWNHDETSNPAMIVNLS
jgi:hypothetical protein